ncbi:MAG: AraC family transcriptional regulator [Lachnospiraceae bacterium]|nr:AraC family transcriptional regulator [Lachnospiraceae bacterium]
MEVKETLREQVLEWINSVEDSALNFSEMHMKNMPPGTVAEVWGDWTHHNGMVREQDDLMNMDAYHMSDCGYMRYVTKFLLEQESSFFRQQCKDSELTEAHRHEYVELAYIVSGTLRQRIVGGDEVFQAGEVCVIGQNSVHQDYLVDEDSVVIFIGISNDLFGSKNTFMSRYSRAQDFFRDLVVQRKKDLKFIRFIPRGGINEEFEDIIHQIILENIGCRTGYVNIVAGLLERLNDMLMSQFQISMSKGEQSQVRKLLFDDVVDYINQHYASVTLDDLCERFAYNAYYFNRLIKENTGLTYSDYLKNIRMDKAAFLLKTTRDSVDRIAHQVGYTNQGFFYKKFKERFGVLPAEYRTL